MPGCVESRTSASCPFPSTGGPRCGHRRPMRIGVLLSPVAALGISPARRVSARRLCCEISEYERAGIKISGWASRAGNGQFRHRATRVSRARGGARDSGRHARI